MHLTFKFSFYFIVNYDLSCISNYETKIKKSEYDLSFNGNRHNVIFNYEQGVSQLKKSKTD